MRLLVAVLVLAGCEPASPVRTAAWAMGPVEVKGTHECVNRSSSPVMVHNPGEPGEPLYPICSGAACINRGAGGNAGIRLEWPGSLHDCGRERNEPCVSCAWLEGG